MSSVARGLERARPDFKLFAYTVARSFRLYKLELITAKEFADVTGNDIYRIIECCGEEPDNE